MAEEPTPWRNWAGDQVCTPAAIARPRTREGLVAAINRSVDRGQRVKLTGSGHSFTGIALTDEVMIRPGGLNRVLDADPSSGLVRVEAGIVLADLNEALDRRGRALENLGDIDRQTLAGAISTATHGTGAGFPNLSAQVAAIELVLADGSTLEVSAARDPAAFRAARVGLGALGAIYAVTLRTVPAFTIRRVDRPRPLAETLAGLDELVDGLDHFEFYVFPHTDTALCRESTRTEEPPRAPSTAARYAREVALENWIGQALAILARRVPAAIPGLSRLAAAGAGRSTKVDRSHRVYPSERRIRFTEMEYAIPRHHAREAVERVLEVAARPEYRVGYPIEVRFVAGDDALLSPAHGRETCYVAVHQDRFLDWEPYFREVEAIMTSYEGRPHWGKRHFRTAEDLSIAYPGWSEFRRIRARLDPKGVFANPYLDRVLGPVGSP